MGWQLPAGMDRMRIVAALEKLTNVYDAEAARDVIVAFFTLPLFANKGSEWSYQQPGRDSSVKGLTDLGIVSTGGREPNKTVFLNGPREEQVARVGRFKLLKRGTLELPYLMFYDFRDETRIAGQTPGPRWTLLYRRSDLKPLMHSRMEATPGNGDILGHLFHFWRFICTGQRSRFSHWVFKPTHIFIDSEVNID